MSPVAWWWFFLLILSSFGSFSFLVWFLVLVFLRLSRFDWFSRYLSLSLSLSSSFSFSGADLLPRTVLLYFLKKTATNFVFSSLHLFCFTILCSFSFFAHLYTFIFTLSEMPFSISYSLAYFSYLCRQGFLFIYSIDCFYFLLSWWVMDIQKGKYSLYNNYYFFALPFRWGSITSSLLSHQLLNWYFLLLFMLLFNGTSTHWLQSSPIDTEFTFAKSQSREARLKMLWRCWTVTMMLLAVWKMVFLTFNVASAYFYFFSFFLKGIGCEKTMYNCVKNWHKWKIVWSVLASDIFIFVLAGFWIADGKG